MRLAETKEDVTLVVQHERRLNNDTGPRDQHLVKLLGYNGVLPDVSDEVVSEFTLELSEAKDLWHALDDVISDIERGRYG